jgi:hypothetical protein
MKRNRLWKHNLKQPDGESGLEWSWSRRRKVGEAGRGREKETPDLRKRRAAEIVHDNGSDQRRDETGYGLEKRGGLSMDRNLAVAPHVLKSWHGVEEKI